MVSIPRNSILDQLPAHLRQYIIPQKYEDYTPINQAVWRYVMRKNVSFLTKVAHSSYLDGLRITGVSINDIPDMYGMNRILKDIGWAAAAVDGFIPPSAFMEFQAYNVLVIAVDIRTLEHVEYTPAPDIIHEAAGHAPIIANAEYAEYLRRLGEIGSKAIASKHDWEVYTAVRHLSQVKEQEVQDEEAVSKAQSRVDELQSKKVEPSEMSKIRNLQWWSVEYGLIGTLKDYKIYGAGLLSSIGESEWCLKDEVEKLPYTIETADVEFDITRPQPKLFVTPNFAHLSKVLEEFASTMALRSGGDRGLQMLIDSNSLGTIELSTGLQISGIFTAFKVTDSKLSVIKTKGPTALAYRGKELIGHSRQKYACGFVSPLGRLKGINIAIEDMSPRDLEAYGIYEGKDLLLEFEGDIIVSGKVLTGTRNLQGKIILITFSNCMLTYNDEVLFDSGEGVYHMAVGKDLVSAFAGPADNMSFDLVDHQLSPSIRNQVNDQKVLVKEDAYRKVRVLRAKVALDPDDVDFLHKTCLKYSSEWLLVLEIHELAKIFKDVRLGEHSLKILNEIKENNSRLAGLITSGLEMLALDLDI